MKLLDIERKSLRVVGNHSKSSGKCSVCCGMFAIFEHLGKSSGSFGNLLVILKSLVQYVGNRRKSFLNLKESFGHLKVIIANIFETSVRNTGGTWVNLLEFLNRQAI